jgi:photosystem II stability/assembly factor-like uncharacterized protein
MLLRALVLFAVAASVERPGWRILGPGGGGAQFNPAVSPHDPNRAMVSCDMTGAYLTEDGGASWRMVNFGTTVRFFAFDASRPRVVYAQTNRLWRSDDGGRAWKVVYPADASVALDGDHADERALSPDPPIDALAADGDTLWAAMRGALQRSTDGGRQWTRVAALAGRAQRIARRGGAVYVLGADFTAVHDERGFRSFAHAAFVDRSVGFDEGRPYFYGASPEGLSASADGEHWSQSELTFNVRAVAACERRGRIAYASLRAPTGFGVARTDDGGRTWRPVWQESRVKSPAVDDGWVSERFGPGWGEHPLALAVAPGDPERALGTDMGRTLRTADGGRTWTAAYTKRLADGSFTSTGLDVTTNYGVHFDPFDRDRLFISYTDIGLFVSENRGRSWRSATTSGVPREWVNTTYWVELDPDVRGRMWAAMSGTHDLPRPKMWRRASPERYRGGVCRSDDGGKTWRAMTNGLPQTAATHILLDRRSPASARVLYVAGFGRGVFRSDDGGATWSAKNRGLPEREPFAWRLTLDREGVLYLVVARRSEDGRIGDEQDGSLYRSRDRAETWERVALPEGVNGPNGLAVDPDDVRRLYLAAWARRGARNGGVFLSTDRGATWKRVHDADQHVYDVTTDPRRPGLLYACGFESSAWRSEDRGATWRRIPGYDFKWGHRVIPDPSDPESLYVTTYGGSVWRGPAR